MEDLRVVLVEDHKALRESLERVIGLGDGLRVVGRAASASEFRTLLAGREPFEVALMDLYLPDADGAQLVSETRSARPEARVVVLTNSLHPDDRERTLSAGAHTVLSKAASVEEIIDALRGG